MDPAKLVLHFSDFFVIFYAIYKKQGNGNTIGVTLLREGPWKDFRVCNVVPRRGGRRGWAKSGELAAVLGRGRARGWSRGARGLVWGVGQGRGDAGERPAGSQRLRPPRLAKPARGASGGGLGWPASCGGA
jgi:hypothetical protein